MSTSQVRACFEVRGMNIAADHSTAACSHSGQLRRPAQAPPSISATTYTQILPAVQETVDWRSDTSVMEFGAPANVPIWQCQHSVALHAARHYRELSEAPSVAACSPP